MEISKQTFIFFSILENDLQLEIPHHIKNILNVRGFNSAFIFKTIEQEDIERMQDYVRSKLPDLLKSHSEDEKFGEFDSNFFGAFSNRLADFEFNTGEERLIQQMAQYVKEKVDTPQLNSNLAHFQNVKQLSVKKIRFWKKELIDTPFGFIFGPEDGDGNTNKRKKAVKKSKDLDIDSLKQNLCQSARRTIRSHFARSGNIENEVEKLDMDCVDVHFDENMKIKGIIECPLSHKENENRIARPYYQILNGAGYWIMSNYGSHMNKYHAIKSSTDDKSSEASSSTANNLMRNSMEQNNYSTVSLEIEPVNVIQSSIDEHLQQCEDNLYKQMSFQNLKILNTALSNNELIEVFPMQSSQKCIPLQKIKICRIDGDNSCLYGAIAHQLFFVELKSLEHEKLKKELRQRTVQHIKDNISDFIPHLRNRVYGIKKKNQIIDMEEECRAFVNTHLIDLDCWAGTESIKAISELYEVNIIIVNDDGTCNSTELIKAEYSRTITISFRCVSVVNGIITNKERNHYDSVVEMAEDAINLFSKSIMSVDLKRRKFTEEKKDCEIITLDD